MFEFMNNHIFIIGIVLLIITLTFIKINSFRIRKSFVYKVPSCFDFKRKNCDMYDSTTSKCILYDTDIRSMLCCKACNEEYEVEYQKEFIGK